MAGAAAGLGPGVLVLLLLWALALLLSGALGRAAGRARQAALPVVLGAAALTAALLLFPREEEAPAPAPAREREIVDTFFIGRFVLLSMMSLIFLVCLFLLLIYHLREPVYAKALPSGWRQQETASPGKRKSQSDGSKSGREARRWFWS